MENLRLAALFCAVAAMCGGLLSACGGGGDGPPAQQATTPPSPSPPVTAPAPNPACAPVEGRLAATSGAFAVGGTIAGRADPSFIMLPVPSPFDPAYGRYRRILVYGPDLAASSALSGFIDAGDSYWCDGSTAYNGYDYGIDGGWTPASHVYLHTTVDALSGTVSGSIRSPTALQALDGRSLPGAAAGYTFNQPSTLADIAGAWRLHSTGGIGYDVQIGADGQLTATGNGATFSTRLTPSPQGVNLLEFGSGYPVGVGMSYPLTTGERQLLLVWYLPGAWEDTLSAAIGRR